MDSNKPDFEPQFHRNAFLEVLGEFKPFIIMLASCLTGMFLLYRAHVHSCSFLGQIILYFTGCVLLLPSLLLFFMLYQDLLKPRNIVFYAESQEGSEANHETV
ncbi:hypothetical protein TVAG_306180 [Trichomonas vaginalis G3]|uniref:Uncharacterized protein n=1 Tax=Trichomonas vaginalis (strain ATCC PRA-98 / G3) TaxID=412133 RepID=A2DNA9_TRIV3|nr:hypothetical protein TVAGG3_1024330 [Trichomonas vaginalis G3]EAY18097.1 hypothetical protein TVAG_306180 [Trichomonas vaginalis G3]KAI5492374.1 hypothetical protein TVAGG3_1024330 [Trichomonas vaginalis G3]|eukprot:XP_001579083.1 hypothetical protein [Trichomonas vaginalis G3]